MRARRPRSQGVHTFVLLLASATPALPGGALSSVECLGEMSNVLHSRAPLPLIPPTPFSHKGRRGSLGVLEPETEDGTQRLANKPTLVRLHAGETRALPSGDSIDRHSFWLSAIAVAP